MEYSSPRWFSFSTNAHLRYFGKKHLYFKLFNFFNRHTADGDHWWGLGFLQLNKRHLFYVGHSGVSVLFIGKTK